MTELSSRYAPSEIESKWYAHWMSQQYFESTPDEREPYTIVIPPPNVTGVLHMGHMLNNTIQDVLIRRARQQGYNACWVPGTDHASIATEAKVVKLLREQGIKKSDLSREEFLEHAFAWKDKYGGIILEQLKRLGASCDWSRTRFTMEPKLSEAVVKVFVDLYKRGLLYRGLRMVNWDPEAQTVLSNEEVIYSEEQSKLYKIRYQIEGCDEFLTIATTRPETILGDTAIAVNPKDERYLHLHGKRVLVPLINRSVPIIADRYVDLEFGTGALKVTPAHDMNDYEIGKRHDLETVDIFNPDATLSEAAQLYVGQDRFAVRKQIAKDLDAAGHLVEAEDYKNKVGRSERTNAVVEPRLSLQWFVKMEQLTKPALDAVLTNEVEFFPKNQVNLYKRWMEENRDWCISRQLWWGQQIPAWYLGEEVFVAETSEEALAQAKEKTGNQSLTIDDLHREEDVVDTWFSSWLWPISVFDGFDKDKTDFDYYYPTSVLVTGWDIIFLWVARMVMAGYAFKDQRPFKDVYFTGMVRDKKRRKMSKSLGNSPDALELLDTFGADAVRFGMLNSSPAGGDLLYDEKLIEQGRNFCNKIWNALRLIKGWPQADNPNTESRAANDARAAEWFEAKLNTALSEIDEKMKSYRLSEVSTILYTLIWDDFCSWYLEMIKPPYGESISSNSLERTLDLFEQLMAALHPFMPFVTEEVWHKLKDRQHGEDCIISSYPKAEEDFSLDQNDTVELVKTLVSRVREHRQSKGISHKVELALEAKSSDVIKQLMSDQGAMKILINLANLSQVVIIDQPSAGTASIMIATDQFFIEQPQGSVDVEAEKERIQAEIKRLTGFAIGIDKKLQNQGFVNNAPAKVVEMERKKLADSQTKITSLQSELERLS